MSGNKVRKKSGKQRLIMTLLIIGVFLILWIVVYNQVTDFLFARYMLNYPGPDLIQKAEMMKALRKILLSVGSGMVILIMVVIFLVLQSYYRRETSLHKTALYDKLTGLPNWQGLKAEASQLPDQGRDYALVLFHINYFKRINSAFGFDAGGRLLRDVAAAILQQCSEDELACRISEDHYAMLLHDDQEPALTERLNQVFAALDQVRIKEKNITYNYPCTYTAGVCLMREMEPGETISDIKDKARIVMESYSSARVTRWKYFDEESKKELVLKRELEKSLASAFQNREFVPYFQPLFQMEGNELAGAEVLARWKHPEFGLITPKNFISLLERAGAILELDMSMLEAACKRLRGWMDQGLLPVPIMVNMSKLNIHRQDFLDRVTQIVTRYQIPTNLIGLELPETVSNDDTEKVAFVVGQLKERGFLLTIDVARSGKITLDCLQKIPFDYMKIDRSFLLDAKNDERNRMVLKHLLQMAAALQISLIVKGVENREQLDALRVFRPEMAQGQYFAEAMEEGEFEQIAFTGE